MPDCFELTTDRSSIFQDPYVDAVRPNVDYAQLQRLYVVTVESAGRNSCPSCIATNASVVAAKVDPDNIVTAHLERKSLTARISRGRITRLTSGFSNYVANLTHAVAIHFMHYSFEC